MKMQHIRVGVASLIVATVIGAGASAQSAHAAPAVKTYSNVQNFTITESLIKDIASKYGIDLSKISFNGITITFPSSGSGSVVPATPAPTTKPAAPTVTPAPTTKPTTPTATPAPTATPKPTTTPSTGSGDSAGMSAYQSQVVDLVNQERAKAGLSALKVDALLTKVATEKARDMDVNNYFSHTSPTYGSPFDMMRQFGVTYSYAGENIASGQRTPQEVMTAWMNSAGHRANILNSNFTKIGVGYVNGEWVQEFTG
jgi:uncharacterized YkwD family protein